MDRATGATGSRYESLTRALAHVVWITDADGRFSVPQPTWEAYTGQPWSEYQGLGWQKAVHPEDLAAILRDWEASREDKALFVAEGRMWHAPSRHWRHFEVRAVPNTGTDGFVREWIGTCIDIQDRKNAEQQLRIADRRKDEFMAVLAHELRNPLAPIRNAVHVLKMCRDDASRSTWARNIIERQVDQMARLLDDLLDLTRIARGKLEVHRDRVHLGEVIERAVETSRPLLDAQGHAFELRLPQVPVMVQGDGPRLAQVFANLLNNAAKYTDRGGRISLSLSVEDGEAVVRVSDNGIGIDPAVLPHMFRMYAQAGPAQARSQGGLGIGLSLVRGLVAMHGGRVEAHSPGVGLGSEFTVRLPALVGGAGPEPAEQGGEPATGSVRVLVADDNHDAAQTLAVLLEVLGHEVHVAGDGLEAVEIARRVMPRVVLLDIGMPRLDGYEAARRIREFLPDALLVATTGWGRREDIRAAAAAGFDQHLVKPVDPLQVARLLDAVQQDEDADLHA